MRTGQRLELGAASLLTVGVYVLLYLVQMQLFNHGLASSVPFAWPRTDVDPQQVQRSLNTYLLLVGISSVLYTWVLLRVSPVSYTHLTLPTTPYV